MRVPPPAPKKEVERGFFTTQRMEEEEEGEDWNGAGVNPVNIWSFVAIFVINEREGLWLQIELKILRFWEHSSTLLLLTLLQTSNLVLGILFNPICHKLGPSPGPAHFFSPGPCNLLYNFFKGISSCTPTFFEKTGLSLIILGDSGKKVA